MTEELSARISCGYGLWRKGGVEPPKGRNSLGPSRTATCNKAAADRGMATASRSVMRQEPDSPITQWQGKLRHPRGSPFARWPCMRKCVELTSLGSRQPPWSWSRVQCIVQVS
jgi:hypothetical protein